MHLFLEFDYIFVVNWFCNSSYSIGPAVTREQSPAFLRNSNGRLDLPGPTQEAFCDLLVIQQRVVQPPYFGTFNSFSPVIEI